MDEVRIHIDRVVLELDLGRPPATADWLDAFGRALLRDPAVTTAVHRASERPVAPFTARTPSRRVGT